MLQANEILHQKLETDMKINQYSIDAKLRRVNFFATQTHFEVTLVSEKIGSLILTLTLIFSSV